MTSPTGTQAVDRAAQLLVEVARHRDPVSFTELIAASGLAKSTTSRLLTALERNGLVRRDVAGRFSPGEVFLSYAWRGGAEADLIALAQPVLAQLGEQTGETINLGVPRDGGLVEQVAQVDSRYLIGGTNWVGLTVPLHCAALGKVLLAFGAAELPKGRLERRTARTITSRTALTAELALVRERGYAVTIEELEPGLVAVAAPVFVGGAVLADGPVLAQGTAAVGAISVSGPASRLNGSQLTAAAESCMAAAHSLSAQLGHDPQARAAVRTVSNPPEEGTS
ncbi:MAG TPA: IclR family transcriptional regulator [Streptosporangiaceae bacterium]|nr:IclR family transcriptional regulator [Streptosporangiaceae bacterium]